MRKIFLIILSVMMIFSLTGCGDSVSEKNSANSQNHSKILVAYFSCTGNTKNLAENAADILQADLYEIKPKVPYTPEDLNYKDETARATAEQRDEKARPELADKNLNLGQYNTVVIAYPIWWHIAPRIIETFLESYDFSGKKIIPICTSGGSDLVESVDNLKNISGNKVEWIEGKCFFKNYTKDEIKRYFDTLNLK